MKKNIFVLCFIASAMMVFIPNGCFASTGVSVDTAKISLQKSIEPGGKYSLPNIEVKNTGTEASDYNFSIEYNEVQSEMKPKADWFSFEPATFHLLPGESKIVKTELALPSGTKSGEYFAYLEANALNKEMNGKLPISGAAASKLYFSVSGSNFLKAAYYSSVSFIKSHTPWSYIVLWIISLFIFDALIRRLRFLIKNSKIST